MTVFSGNDGRPRILVLAPNWLGDVVMATPLLAMLQGAGFGPNRQPARLILGVRRRWSVLFKNDSRFESILVLERSGRHGGPLGLVKLVQDLRRQKADAVLLGPPSLRVGLASWLAQIPLRVGFRTDGRSIVLNSGLRFPGRGPMHYSNQLLSLGQELLQRLDGQPSGDGLPENLLPGFESCPVAGMEDGPPLWVLGVSTTYGLAKVWPRMRVLEFLHKAVADFGVRVVLLGEGCEYGAPDEADGFLASVWRKDLAGPSGVVDLVGRTTLTEAGTLLRGAAAFVGNDSGLMHLAAVLGTPTLGIFGSSNPDWTAPQGPITDVITAQGFSCSPCFRAQCNQGQFCLESISAQEVLTALSPLLDKESTPSEVEP